MQGRRRSGQSVINFLFTNTVGACRKRNKWWVLAHAKDVGPTNSPELSSPGSGEISLKSKRWAVEKAPVKPIPS